MGSNKCQTSATSSRGQEVQEVQAGVANKYRDEPQKFSNEVFMDLRGNT